MLLNGILITFRIHVLLAILSVPKVNADPTCFCYDIECADRVFKKYLKDVEPEYKSLQDKGKFALEDNYRHAMESLFVKAADYNYEIKAFSESEIREFITKYKKYLPENLKQISTAEIANKIFENTGGYPIMV